MGKPSGLSASSKKKNNIEWARRLVSDIKLKRTDTTLDLSQRLSYHVSKCNWRWGVGYPYARDLKKGRGRGRERVAMEKSRGRLRAGCGTLFRFGVSVSHESINRFHNLLVSRPFDEQTNFENVQNASFSCRASATLCWCQYQDQEAYSMCSSNPNQIQYWLRPGNRILLIRLGPRP